MGESGCLQSRRNGSPRAGFAVEENGEIYFRFTDYDIERTVSGIREIGLPKPFSDRWINFVRSGFDREWSRPWEK